MLSRALPLFLLIAGAACAQSAEVFAQVDGMLHSLSQITGWEVKRKVPSEILTRKEFAKIVAGGVKDAEGDKDVRATEITLKMFGLAPWDFNLARESGDLIEEQAAAFYDPRKKRLFILESIPEGNEQRMALVHELAHALADQHYPLNKYLEGAKTDDEATARQSVVEGQASWLSWAYIAQSAGRRAEVPRALLDELSGAVGGTGADFPVLSRVPLYIRESLVFPYSEGMRFQDAVYRRIGSGAFDRLFQEPPRSTHEILHPDEYGSSAQPTEPALPDLDRILGRQARELRKLIEGDVGEFDYSALLRQYIPEREGRSAARGWRGGTYRLYEHKKERYPVLVHSSEWGSPEAAREFFRLYKEVLRGKWKRMDVRSDSETELTGAGDTGDFLVRLDGVYVQCVEGIHRSGPVQ
jgi:hypothetical protein